MVYELINIPIRVDQVDFLSEPAGCLENDFFALFALISTGVFILFVVPMEPWFVSACSVSFQARVDKCIRD